MLNRYCIGCQHLQLTPPTPGRMWSTATGWESGNAASLACLRNHWQLYISREENTTVLDLENAMLHAATCPDYQERA